MARQGWVFLVLLLIVVYYHYYYDYDDYYYYGEELFISGAQSRPRQRPAGSENGTHNDDDDSRRWDACFCHLAHKFQATRYTVDYATKLNSMPNNPLLAVCRCHRAIVPSVCFLQWKWQDFRLLLGSLTRPLGTAA